jgi:hypothetical protein
MPTDYDGCNKEVTMNKLAIDFPPENVHFTSDPLTFHPVQVNTSQRSDRCLIVLVPADSDHAAMTHRVWKLANETGMRVQFLSLCKDAAQEPALRRALITTSALIQDGRVSAEVKVEIGTNWVDVVKRNYQTGDMIVCFAEHRAGLWQRPLSQILKSDLGAPVYLLSGLYSESRSQSNLLLQLMAWAGSIGIIVGSALLQIQITSFSQDWAQTTLLILSVIGEVWLIWAWNSLFS